MCPTRRQSQLEQVISKPVSLIRLCFGQNQGSRAAWGSGAPSARGVRPALPQPRCQHRAAFRANAWRGSGTSAPPDPAGLLLNTTRTPRDAARGGLQG